MPVVALVAHDVDSARGMERTMAELLRRGAGSGEWEFVVVSTTLAPELRPYASWCPVRAPRRPVAVKFPAFWLRAGLALRRIDADLVHVAGAIVPNRADLATVHLSHRALRRAPGEPEAGLPRRVNTGAVRLMSRLAERWSYRPARTRLLAAVSEGLAAELRRDFPGVPVTVTPNGVDAERYRPDPRAREITRALLGVPDDDVVVLFAGGDWARKGLGILVRAVALAGPPLRLWVAGEGDAGRMKGLGDATYLGPRDDLPAVMAAADVLALPSAYETFSLVAYEAAACGLPVVGTRVHGVTELVGDGEAGVLCERTPEAFAAALRDLAVDPGRRRTLGARARERAAAYTWEASYASVDRAYRSLLAGPRGRMGRT